MLAFCWEPLTTSNCCYGLTIGLSVSAGIVRQLLAVDAITSPGNGAQALAANIRFAFQAKAIRALLNSFESASQFIVSIRKEFELADGELTIGSLSNFVENIRAAFDGNLLAPV
jgi:hypothetical protein